MMINKYFVLLRGAWPYCLLPHWLHLIDEEAIREGERVEAPHVPLSFLQSHPCPPNFLLTLFPSKKGWQKNARPRAH